VQSTFPVQPFVRAAAAQLFTWAEKKKAPPRAPRIDMDPVAVVSVPRLDEHGNAEGGVRSPFVDVPLVRYEVQSSPGFCIFAGRETPLPPDVLASRYGDVDTYVDEFTKSLATTIDAGHLLKMDRAEILDAATAKAESLLPAG